MGSGSVKLPELFVVPKKLYQECSTKNSFVIGLGAITAGLPPKIRELIESDLTPSPKNVILKMKEKRIVL